MASVVGVTIGFLVFETLYTATLSNQIHRETGRVGRSLIETMVSDHVNVPDAGNVSINTNIPRLSPEASFQGLLAVRSLHNSETGSSDIREVADLEGAVSAREHLIRPNEDDSHLTCTSETVRLDVAHRLFTALQTESLDIHTCSTDLNVFPGERTGDSETKYRYSFNPNMTGNLVPVKATLYARVKFLRSRPPVALVAKLKSYDGIEAVILQKETDRNRNVCLAIDVSCHVGHAYDDISRSTYSLDTPTMNVGISLFCKYHVDGDYRSCEFDSSEEPFIMVYYLQRQELERHCKPLSMFTTSQCFQLNS